MKVSFQALSRHLDLAGVTAERVAEVLPMLGLEVESVTTFGLAPMPLVVVGRIVSFEKHPKADRLSVCQVDVGDGAIRQIVCGAKNFKAGDRVPVALPGTVMPSGFTISVSKLRDVDSAGMMCSSEELGLGKGEDGLLILTPRQPAPGTPLNSLFGAPDTVLEISVTPNRGDCLSLAGLAREVGAMYSAAVSPIAIDAVAPAHDEVRPVEVLAPKAAQPESAEDKPVVVEPDWLRAQAPAEQRPPRPLAPSAPVEDDVPNPPPTAAMRQAAERGRWLHALFQRLPDLPAERRREGAGRWLEQQGAGDATLHKDVIDHALRVIEDPHFAALFAQGALAEAPIAAVVGEAVIAGTVDRLRVEADRVQLVDFKTGRMTPRDAEEVPVAHVRQMAAYVAALEVIFPGRAVEAALLYTSAARLIALPAAQLAPYKPGFSPTQQYLLL